MSQFLWGIFPYVSILVMIVGTLYRYKYNQMSWTSKSSEFLEKRLLIIGNMLFHWGILFVLVGHIMGLLVPMQWYALAGISTETYHALAVAVGGIAGIVALIGISILLYRRIFNLRIRIHSDFSDFLSDGLLFVIMIAGLSETLLYPLFHGSPYEYRATIGVWIRSVIMLHPDIALMTHAPLIYQLHTLAAFIIFGISPFTRLIHMYSVPLKYFARAPLQYRARNGFTPPGKSRTKKTQPELMD